MNSKELVKRLEEVVKKTFLSKESKEAESVEVKLETARLKDEDIMIEAESFEAGNEVFAIAAEGERIKLPMGEYELEDGKFLVVEQEGVIASVNDVKNESEEEVVEEEVEMEQENETPKKVVESVSKEIHFSEDQRNELKELVKSWFVEFQEVEVEEVKPEKEEVELSEQVPAGKVIKHSPEANTQKKKQIVLGSNKPMTTVDRILRRQQERK